MNKIDAIFFDFDGVILESVDVKGWAFGKLFEAFPEQVEKIVEFHYANGGMSRFEKFRHIYAHILNQPLSDRDFESLCKRFSELVFNRVISCEYVPGALEFIEEHSKNIKMFIISGTPQDEIEQIVLAKKIDGHFLGVYGSPTGKSYWVKKILRDHMLIRGRTFFVGDAMSDYQAAKDNQIKFVARMTAANENVFKSVALEYHVKDLFEFESVLT